MKDDFITKFLRTSKKRGYHYLHYRDPRGHGGCRVKMYLSDSLDTVGFTCLVKEMLGKTWTPDPHHHMAYFYFNSQEAPLREEPIKIPATYE